MQCIAFPSPVLPGKEDSPGKFGQELSANPGLADFVDRSGIGLLRVFQMSTPMGDVVTTYMEAASRATPAWPGVFRTCGGRQDRLAAQPGVSDGRAAPG